MEVLAACHVHSEWSYDGRCSLKNLAEKFSRRGCRILLMTEHDLGFTARRFEEYRAACMDAGCEKVLLVPGIEYSDKANRVHVLVWGTPFLGEGMRTEETLEAVREANGAAVLAHPSRNGAWRDFGPHWGNHLLGVEVWNRKYDGWVPSKSAPLLLKSGDFLPFAGLDYHTDRQLFPLTMKLELPDIITEQEVLNCLKARRCSAQAFGIPLSHNLLRAAMPVLGIAERGRRKASSLIKRSRGVIRK